LGLIFQQNTDAKGENEGKIYDDDQIFDPCLAFDFGLVQAEPCEFQLLEQRFNFEPFAVIATSHFAQIHVRQWRNLAKSRKASRSHNRLPFDYCQIKSYPQGRLGGEGGCRSVRYNSIS